MTGQSAFRSRIKGDKLAEFFQYLRKSGVEQDSLVFVCIGTDRSTGDSLGPLVGTLLTEAGFESVIGTLENPCDSSNIAERLLEIPQDKCVLAIDACLGHPSSVGQFQVSSGPLVPGQSVGKGLPPVGDYGLAAIVGIDGPKPYTVLQTTSLHRVMTMARLIASAAIAVFAPPQGASADLPSSTDMKDVNRA
jgi:putative sporulation protein YyaC